MVDIKGALSILKKKLILGEYGPQTRPFVVLDIKEYEDVVEALEKAVKTKRVPRETSRQTSQTV